MSVTKCFHLFFRNKNIYSWGAGGGFLIFVLSLDLDLMFRGTCKDTRTMETKYAGV